MKQVSVKNLLSSLIKYISFTVLVFNSYLNTSAFNVPMLVFMLPYVCFMKVSFKVVDVCIFFTLAIIVVAATLNSFANGHDDIAFLKFSLYSCTLACCISGFVRTHKFTTAQFINALLFLLTVNSIFIIITTLYPSTRVIYSIIAINPKVFTYPIPRYPGFVYDGFSYLSVFIVLALTLCLVYKKRLTNKVSSTTTSIVSSINMLGVLISGRLGILLSLFSMPLWPKKVILINIIFIAVIAMCISILYADIFEIIASYVVWNLFQVVNIVFSGVSTDTSASDLVHNHFVFSNEKLFTLLFGSGDFGFGKTTYISDSGYIKVFNGLGFIGGTAFILGIFGLLFDRSLWMVLFFSVFFIVMLKDFYLLFPYYFWSIPFFWLCTKGIKS